MYTQVTFNDFVDAFNAVRPDNFSREGLLVVFDYLTELEEETDEPMQLDVIALCCAFTELPYGEIASDYNIDISEAQDEDGNWDDGYASELVLDHLHFKTSVLGSTNEGTVVFQAY